MKKNLAIALIFTALFLSACTPQYNPGDTTKSKIQDTALRTYHFYSSEDVESISDDDLIYIVQHNYSYADFKMEPQIRDIDLFDVPIAEFDKNKPALNEQISMISVQIDAGEIIDLERPLSKDTLQSYADSYCNHMIESANTYDGDTGSQTKDEEIIYCGENDFYIEYSIRYTEIMTMYQNMFRTTTEIPRTYRRCFMKNMVSIADDSRTYKAYAGKVTKEAIQDEMDSFIAGNSIPALYREVSETDEAVIYTYYEAYTVGGDYGMSDTAMLIKNENIYNKVTHEEKLISTCIKEIEIPGTEHNLP